MDTKITLLIILIVIVGTFLIALCSGVFASDRGYFIQTEASNGYFMYHEVKLDRRLGIDRCIFKTGERSQARLVLTIMKESE